MKIDGAQFRTIWRDGASARVMIIDQRLLPHDFVIAAIENLESMAAAIETMQVRGAPLIGASAAYGLALAMEADPTDAGLDAAGRRLVRTRPTAVNLRWAVERISAVLSKTSPAERAAAAWREASDLCEEDVAVNTAIGRAGVELIADAARRCPDRRVSILTHCNAGWLATVDRGTALAPIFEAVERGIDLHVWVDETRPRNQGASLTAWELNKAGIPHTVIADNAGGHLMQHGEVDLCIVGTDRTTARGDVCNKIGTYLKALAAFDNGVPFYVAAPSSSIDWTIEYGVKEIPIEERSAEEVSRMTGRDDAGVLRTVTITPAGSPCANPAFDVTPARYVTGLITERGVTPAEQKAMASLFPDLASRVRSTVVVER